MADKTIKDFLEKGKFIKIVYIDSISENENGIKKERTRAFFGNFIDITEEFIVAKYPNESDDKIFIKQSNIISISEESKK